MDNRLMLFALHQMAGIGWKTIQALVSRFSDLTELINVQPAEWLTYGLPPARASRMTEGFTRLRADGPEAALRRYAERGIGWITCWDSEYPELLRETAQPPWVLYYSGAMDYAHHPCIAMVGTRRPTVYGKTAAERLAASLSEQGFTVVSGLARGIDTSAHEGALRGPGKTIGVLGCSLDEVYPPENKGLYRAIAADGLLISEYPLGTKSHPGLFPQRNRVIAGLSLGVVVVEAALRSGSLITADQALEASRDVFAVPGPITSPSSQGTHALLKQGAKLAACAEDIIEEYEHRISKAEKTYINNTPESDHALTQQERAVLEWLMLRPMTVDELLDQSQYNFGHLHSVLINLLMMRRIVELPGSVYTVP